MQIEVAYARPDQQVIVSLQLPEGGTAAQAIERSGLLQRFPEIDLAVNKIGIFSRAVKLDTVLRDKDRVEIYRPLLSDPKAVRRQRAAESKRKDES